MAQIEPGIGRDMSPVAGAGIIVTGIAQESIPMEILACKTHAVPMYHCDSSPTYATVIIIKWENYGSASLN